MRIYSYASADAINQRPDLLDLLQEEHDLQGVIIRDASAAAIEHVRQRGLEALWLAPGLWGDVEPEANRRAIFPQLENWDRNTFHAYERQFPMTCANSPDLARVTGTYYATHARDLGASGIFVTHLRYHHPANLDHLWGCICDYCGELAADQYVALGEVSPFLNHLSIALRKLPSHEWNKFNLTPAIHPLLSWWCTLTESDFPIRWFAWKSSTIAQYLTEVKAAYTGAAPELTFANNCFEPFFADLVGNHLSTQQTGPWYAPLLGYWPHHVRASVRNLAGWHMALAGQHNLAEAEQSLATLIGIEITSDPGIGIREQIRMGSKNASALGRPYYPVLNGTMVNQFGSRADQFRLREGMFLAQELGANGIILQGISQLLDEPALDFWH